MKTQETFFPVAPERPVSPLADLTRHHSAAQAAVARLGGAGPREIMDALVGLLPDGPFVVDDLRRVPTDLPCLVETYFLGLLDAPPVDAPGKERGTLSTWSSIRCLRDEVRTKRFLQGVADAVAELESRTAGPIRVVDAGCGAFPILGAYAALRSPRVSVDCLEANAHSAQTANQVVRALGLRDRVRIILADARHFSPEPTDLLVSETMDTALTAEPIADIVAHLVKFLKPDGIVLPGRITVQAALATDAQRAKTTRWAHVSGHRTELGNYDWRTVATWEPRTGLEEISFCLEAEEDGPAIVLLNDEITVGKRVIGHGDALITTPTAVRKGASDEALKLDLRRGDRVHVRYRPGQRLTGNVARVERREGR